MFEQRIYPLWVHVYPAEDLPGTWVAHVLDMSVVTHGNSALHALDMAHEAASMLVEDDLNSGLDPMGRPRAELKEWEALWALMEGGVRISREDVDRLGATKHVVIDQLAMQIEILVQREVPDQLAVSVKSRFGFQVETVAA